MQPNFIFVSLPIVPVRTDPVLKPIRRDIWGSFKLDSSWFKSPSACCCASAAAHALTAWSATSSGVLKKASRPSPSISETTPSNDSTTLVIYVKYLVRRRTRFFGSRDSAMLVKLEMSENITVTSLLETCCLKALCSPRSILLTMVSGRYFEKTATLCSILDTDAARWLTSCILDACIVIKLLSGIAMSELDPELLVLEEPGALKDGHAMAANKLMGMVMYPATSHPSKKPSIVNATVTPRPMARPCDAIVLRALSFPASAMRRCIKTSIRHNKLVHESASTAEDVVAMTNLNGTFQLFASTSVLRDKLSASAQQLGQ
mmetsp:Transcript_60929/g.145199  ORF Transcript_60929/g.145199 Transcript_60929/m.145199 type:complete len:318 (+) Transcript_60929:564-1517(+)